MDVPESVFSPETPDKQRQMSDNSVRVASPGTRFQSGNRRLSRVSASACHAEGRGFESHQPLRKGLNLQAFSMRPVGWCVLPRRAPQWVPATSPRRGRRHKAARLQAVCGHSNLRPFAPVARPRQRDRGRNARTPARLAVDCERDRLGRRSVLDRSEAHLACGEIEAGCLGRLDGLEGVRLYASWGKWPPLRERTRPPAATAASRLSAGGASSPRAQRC